jgi:proteasome lid subunit RPN8/RPN11
MENPNGGLISLPKFVEHKIAENANEPITAALYEYVTAGNGLLLRAERSEFAVSLPLLEHSIRGLPDVATGIFWKKPRIASALWQEILADARARSEAGEFKEDVYVVFWDDLNETWRWKCVSRERRFAATIADDAQAEYGKACLELHTHPPGAIRFSQADDRDESDKFRIFGILIDVHADAPKVRFRCGVYDFFKQIPAAWVGEMPAEFIDLNQIDLKLKEICDAD